MYGFLRQPRWIFLTILVVVIMPTFLVLANWQWSRAGSQSTQDTLIAAALADPVVPVSRLLAPGGTIDDTVRYRSVSATGEFEVADQVLVRRRPAPENSLGIDGNGFWVLTPLRTSDGTLLWVNRGWTSASAGPIDSPTVPAPPTGEVTITGRVQPEEGPGAFAADLPAGQINRISIEELSAPLGATAYPGYVELQTAAPDDDAGLLRFTATPQPIVSEGRHISYAVQWVLFALIAIGGWFLLLRREAKEIAEAREAAGPMTDPLVEPLTGPGGPAR